MSDVSDVPGEREPLPGEMPWRSAPRAASWAAWREAGWAAWRAAWRERLDRLPVEPSQVAAGIVASVVLLIGGVGWAVSTARSRPSGPPVEELLPRADTTTTVAGSTGAGAGAGDSSDEVVVHVAGAVGRPGLYRLPSPARVADAVAAAGGTTGEADLDRVNLAAPVADGERVYVPRRGEPAPEVAADAAGGGPPSASTGGGRGGVSAPGARLDLNTATVEQLEALPGIGPATARAIVEHRSRHGPFRSVRQLLDVRGIGEAKLAALESRLRT